MKRAQGDNEDNWESRREMRREKAEMEFNAREDAKVDAYRAPVRHLHVRDDDPETVCGVEQAPIPEDARTRQCRDCLRLVSR